MLRYWIWLAQAEGLRPATAKRLLEHFPSPEAVYYADETVLAEMKLRPAELAALRRKELEPSVEILNQCYRKHIRIMTLNDGAYPQFLREIPDPPIVLYHVGRLPEISDRPKLGVVGARDASRYGLSVAEELSRQIAECGGIVVTGLARGIDTCAAKGALQTGAPVIGVLGCGVDVVYPPENLELFRSVARSGCILSEYPPGTKPLPMNFPRRNRIISGISDGVVVVEAAPKSGALITARLANEQGRDVFAVPGRLGERSCEGSNRLLRSGAICVTCGWDAVEEYETRYPDTIREPGVQQIEAAPEDTSDPQPEQPANVPSQPAPQPCEPLQIPDDASEEERAVLTALSEGEQHIDEIISRVGLSPAAATTTLTLLQVKGLVAAQPGKRYRLAGALSI